MSKVRGCSQCCRRAVLGCMCECLSCSPVGPVCPALQPGTSTLGMLPPKGCSKPLSSSQQQARAVVLGELLCGSSGSSASERPSANPSDLRSDLHFVYIWDMLLDVFKAGMVQGCSQVGG